MSEDSRPLRERVDRRYLAWAAALGAVLGLAAWALVVTMLWAAVPALLVYIVLGALALSRLARVYVSKKAADRASIVMLAIPLGLLPAYSAGMGPMTVAIPAILGAVCAVVGAVFAYVKIPFIDR